MVQHSAPSRFGAGVLAVLAVAALAACGGGGSSQPAGSIKVTLSEFKFDPSSIDAKAGKVTLFLVNSGSAGHDLVVQDSTGKVIAKSQVVSGGGSAVLQIPDLAAGSYTIVCDVPGHSEAGMKGTLNVS